MRERSPDINAMIEEELNKNGRPEDLGQKPLDPADFKRTLANKMEDHRRMEEEKVKAAKKPELPPAPAAGPDIPIVIEEPGQENPAEFEITIEEPAGPARPAAAERTPAAETAAKGQEKKDPFAEERKALAGKYDDLRERLRQGKASKDAETFGLLTDIVRQVGREDADLNTLILKEGLTAYDQKKHGRNKFIFDVGLETVARQQTSFLKRLEMFMSGPKNSADAVNDVSQDIKKWLKARQEQETRRQKQAGPELLKAQQRIWDARGWRQRQKNLPGSIARKSDAELADYLDSMKKRGETVWKDIGEQLSGDQPDKRDSGS